MDPFFIWLAIVIVILIPVYIAIFWWATGSLDLGSIPSFEDEKAKKSRELLQKKQMSLVVGKYCESLMRLPKF
jgi:flagellar basal body-associated protein FliL